MIQNVRAQRVFLPGFARLAALVLAALLLCAALPSPQAAEWMEPYLEQVQEWGVMRGDANGNLNEDRSITRAEFVTLVNRAFGYTEVGPHTFTDVNPNDWYAEDISIAHQAGYFQGTSPTTASPLSLVTREQAAVLLGRCLRFQGVTGAANSTFTDMQDIGGWSRGLVQEAADLGIIQGYADGSFRPDLPITRGQMACFLVRALGTLVQEPGDQTSGGVYGNLTITVPGVKLKDTTITGNLYLTGGVGLGNVELENVNVLGKIIVCGSGEAERGEHSIILRNVTASSMEVDSLAGQFLSIQAEGLTDIGTTTVRTSAFIQDLTEDGLGLRAIRLDGGEDALFQLAGNLKDVTNLTPNSALEIAQGVAKMVTVDERAIDSTLTIDDKASIVELNLDHGISVTGPGSISHLNVNAEGATVEMLPDTLTVRPGIIANVNKMDMNNIQAAESSEDPRILAGYPLSRNVASTSAEVVFRTNKTGTIYWGLSAMMDGSLGEEELMNPSNYAAKIIRSGTANATAANTDIVTRLTGLTKEGSYYVSAMLVDARGRRSPVKVVAFTTTDDTAPNFATGYPQTPILTTDADGEQIAQIMVMPTKNCQMYYVLLPKGSTAPTAADFRSAALPGNLGFGIVTLRKNTPFLVSRINSSHLQEQTDYDLYLWLNDADNGKSSAVRKITLTTKDLTPPTILKLDVKNIAARTVTMTFSLDEPGMLYWVVVRQGASFYASGVNKDNPSLVGQIQIENGTGSNVVRRGGPVRAARGSTDYDFTISGLEAQTAYDLYYVAKDTAGNYCVYTQSLTPPMEINTLDNEPPTVTQEFSNDGDGPESHPTPYPDSTVSLVFSEVVLGARNEGGVWQYDSFEDAYRDAQSDPDKRTVFANLLKDHIKLYRKPATGRDESITDNTLYERTADNESTIGDNWIIDYRYATVTRDPSGSGEMIISFPYGEGINLGSGETYYFVVKDIADNSDAHNRMPNSTGNREGYKLPEFTTVDAQLLISQGTATGSIGSTPLNFDMNFRLSPEGTNNVSSETLWDMIFWANQSMKFELYCQVEGGSWQKLGDEAEFRPTGGDMATVGISITRELLSSDRDNPSFEMLNNVKEDRLYGIIVTELNGERTRANWTGSASIRVVPVAGNIGSMRVMANTSLTPDRYSALQASNNAVTEIGSPKEYTMTCPFRDTNPPTFYDGYPKFEPGDTSVSMQIMLSRPGSYYYVITKAVNITTELKDGTIVTESNARTVLPGDGTNFDGRVDPTVTGNARRPVNSLITNPTFPTTGNTYIVGRGSTDGSWTEIPITGQLDASSLYTVYFVLQGESPESISDTYVFQFETEDIVRPVLNASLISASEVTVTADRDTTAKGLLIVAGQEPDILKKKMSECWADNSSVSPTAAQIATYKDMTILQAMQEHFLRGTNVDLGSVFDLFADSVTKQSVTNFFTAASQNGTSITKVVNPINLATTSRPPLMQTIDCLDGMKPGNQTYNFVVMGQSPLGSGYAFAAALGLFYPNDTPPQVNTLATSRDPDVPVYDNAAEANNHAYSGTVYIGFSTPLYYNDRGVYKQVVDKPIGAVAGSDYTASAAVLNPGKGTVQPRWTASDPDQPCENLTIKFTQAMPGDTISFSSNLCNSRGVTGTVQLSIELTLVRDAYGLFQPKFVVKSAGWGNPTIS